MSDAPERVLEPRVREALAHAPPRPDHLVQVITTELARVGKSPWGAGGRRVLGAMTVAALGGLVKATSIGVLQIVLLSTIGAADVAAFTPAAVWAARRRHLARNGVVVDGVAVSGRITREAPGVVRVKVMIDPPVVVQSIDPTPAIDGGVRLLIERQATVRLIALVRPMGLVSVRVQRARTS